MQLKHVIASLAVFAVAALPMAAHAGPGCSSAKASACGASKSACASTTKSAEVKIGLPQVNTAALKMMINTNVPMTIVDARSSQWDDGRRIGNAVSLTSDASADQIASVLPSKDQLVVAYCASTQCPASKKLMASLNKMGYKNVIVYEEGVAGWFDEDHANELPEINTTAFMAMKNANAPVAILDARGCDNADDCKKTGHIPGAKELTDMSTAEQVASVLPNKDQLIVSYCGSAACPASEKLASHLKDLGYTNVVIYKEGVAGWTTAGGELAQL
jgi:rhodanese-related sulfurtransferase